MLKADGILLLTLPNALRSPFATSLLRRSRTTCLAIENPIQQSRSAEASGRYNLFEAYEVRTRLNAPAPLSSPGGSHVSLLRYVHSLFSQRNSLLRILREFGGNTLNLFANAMAGSPSPASSGKFPCIFPRNREFRDGDGFADDCLHRQRTKASRELLVPLCDVFHALGSPTTVALRRNTLARKPIRDLPIILPHLPHCGSDVACICVGIFIGHLSDHLSSPTREGERSIARHGLKTRFSFLIRQFNFLDPPRSNSDGGASPASFGRQPGISLCPD